MPLKKLRLLGEELSSCNVAINEHAGCNGSKKGFDTVSDINIMFEREAPNIERGSPSLVGRGIANPMSERTRGFEMLPKGGTRFPLPALYTRFLGIID